MQPVEKNKKKYAWLAVGGAALATFLVGWSIFWPPVPRNGVQGAIGKRDVYRESTMTDKDIGVAGTVKVTVDDIRKVLQSQEFQSLANNAQFNQLIANAQFQQIYQQSSLLTLAGNQSQVAQNQAQLAQNQSQLAQNQAQVLMIQPKLQQLLSSAQFSQLRSNWALSFVMAMPGFAALMNSQQFTQLAGQSQLNVLAGNAALQQAIASQAGVAFLGQ